MHGLEVPHDLVPWTRAARRWSSRSDCRRPARRRSSPGSRCPSARTPGRAPESAAITLQAFAAPVVCAMMPRHEFQAGSVESRGTGSQLQRSAPVRASNARTSPLAAFVRLLSATADPVTMSPLITAGGDVELVFLRVRGRVRQAAPEGHDAVLAEAVGTARPFRASSAKIRASTVPDVDAPSACAPGVPRSGRATWTRRGSPSRPNSCRDPYADRTSTARARSLGFERDDARERRRQVERAIHHERRGFELRRLPRVRRCRRCDRSTRSGGRFTFSRRDLRERRVGDCRARRVRTRTILRPLPEREFAREPAPRAVAPRRRTERPGSRGVAFGSPCTPGVARRDRPARTRASPRSSPPAAAVPSISSASPRSVSRPRQASSAPRSGRAGSPCRCTSSTRRSAGATADPSRRRSARRARSRAG